MSKKMLECPHCGKSSTQWIDRDQYPIFRKMETILQSNKTAHEKKIALFECLKSLEVGELQPLEDQRLNSLLLGKLYNQLAKQCMKDYKKLTVKEYNEEEK
jgi:hypothetical protein